MTDNKRERIAKLLLATFRDIWCDRESDDEPFFNCDKCELKMDDGRCGVKVFLHTKKYEDEYPKGAILEEQSHEID